MTILTERANWRKPRPSNETRRSTDLTPDEQAAVRRALQALRRRLGGWEALARALRVKRGTLENYGKRPPSAAVAIRAARLAEVPVDELLTGRWPKEGACPCCGRGP